MHDNGRFRSLLVAVDADISASTAALTHAMELALAHRAKLTVYVFAHNLLQPFPLTLGSSSIWIEQETDRFAKASAHARHTVRQIASEQGISVSIEHAHSPFEGRYDRFIALARLHDLAILQADKRSHIWLRPAIEHAIFDTGRPVLITPGAERYSIGKVAIAWDGSARASRAVRDSLDFLMVAEEVSIAMVLDTKGSGGLKSADDLSTYLAMYGIQPKIVVIPDQPGGDEGEPIRSFLISEDIELLVMGAFVHSRLRQSVLGGMTRALLDSCPVPIIMAY